MNHSMKGQAMIHIYTTLAGLMTAAVYFMQGGL